MSWFGDGSWVVFIVPVAVIALFVIGGVVGAVSRGRSRRALASTVLESAPTPVDVDGRPVLEWCAVVGASSDAFYIGRHGRVSRIWPRSEVTNPDGDLVEVWYAPDRGYPYAIPISLRSGALRVVGPPRPPSDDDDPSRPVPGPMTPWRT